jgi:uncharacterized membrane protein YciS (DUF1049 family)
MEFEISEKINTGATKNDVLEILEKQFKKISVNVKRENDGLIVKSIEATFGSINRSDITQIDLKEKKSGFLCIAKVNYKPSIMFWVFFLLLFTTAIGWLIPIGFYLYQKKTVSEAIEKTFKRLKDEIEDSNTYISSNTENNLDYTEKLEKLFKLKEKEIISEEEFEEEKEKILNKRGN